MPTLALVAWLACLLARESGLGTGLGTGCGTGFNTPSQVTQSCCGIELIEDEWTHILMMFCRMMLGVVIGNVGGTGGPKNTELFLVYAIADPVEPHIDCLGPLLLDGAIHDAGRRRVVGSYGSRWLRVPHFMECDPEYCAIFCIVEQPTDFGFSR